MRDPHTDVIGSAIVEGQAMDYKKSYITNSLISDDMGLLFHRALSDGSISRAELDEIKIGLSAAFDAVINVLVKKSDEITDLQRQLAEKDEIIAKIQASARTGMVAVQRDALDKVMNQDCYSFNEVCDARKAMLDLLEQEAVSNG